MSSKKFYRAMVFLRTFALDDIETFELQLFDQKVDIYTKNTFGKTPLMHVAENNFVDCLKVLVAANKIENINQCDYDRRSALALAAMYGHTECVRLLIDTGLADVNLCDKNGYTPLMYVVQNGNIECLNYLVDANKIENVNQQYGTDQQTALMMATNYGHTECFKRLIDTGLVDIKLCDKRGYTALLYVIENNHIECLKYLLDANKIENINQKYGRSQQTALMMAAQYGHTECVRILIDTGLADTSLCDSKGQTALMIATMDGNYECVEYLSKIEGIAINCIDTNGKTALILAVMTGDSRCVGSLLGIADIDVNYHDQNNNTALILAAFHGYTECVKILLRNDMLELNASDRGGNTALMLASLNGHTSCVKLLLDHGEVDVNMRNNEGRTALMLALSNRFRYGFFEFREHDFKLVKLLILNKKVDIGVLDNEGNTAFMIATEMFSGFCLNWFFEITVLGNMDRDKECGQRENRFATVFSLPYNDGSVRYCPGISWITPYIYRREQDENSVLKLVIRDGLLRCVVCFLLAGIDVSLSENTPCSHDLLGKRECTDFDKYGQTSLMTAVEKEDFKHLEYFLQFERIRFHILVILLREEFCETGTISLLFYKKLYSLIRNHRDLDQFMCMMCNDDNIGVCVDYLLSAFICQTDSSGYSALSLAIPIEDTDLLRILLNHVSEKTMLINHIEASCKEFPFTYIYFPSLLELLKIDIFHWNWFPKCTHDKLKTLTRELVIRGIPPGCFDWKGKPYSPLHFAFMSRNGGLVRYLVANLYLTSRDLHRVQRDTEIRKFVQKKGSEDLQQLYHQLFDSPWRLETQSLMSISNWLRQNRNRDGVEKVQSSLPEIYRSRLPFINPMRLICQREWKNISLDFMNHRLSSSLSEQDKCCNGCCFSFVSEYSDYIDDSSESSDFDTSDINNFESFIFDSDSHDFSTDSGSESDFHYSSNAIIYDITWMFGYLDTL